MDIEVYLLFAFLCDQLPKAMKCKIRLPLFIISVTDIMYFK